MHGLQKVLSSAKHFIFLFVPLNSFLVSFYQTFHFSFQFFFSFAHSSIHNSLIFKLYSGKIYRHSNPLSFLFKLILQNIKKPRKTSTNAIFYTSIQSKAIIQKKKAIMAFRHLACSYNTFLHSPKNWRKLPPSITQYVHMYVPGKK